jgi:phytoene synthase
VAERVVEASREAIRVGSKSFSAAARLFDRGCREDAYLLYAWCRYCDDRIDAQELGLGVTEESEPVAARLDELRRQTDRALRGEVVGDPAFLALQRVVERHAIPSAYPLQLLEGFAMDVESRRFRTLDDSLTYCYHVAGVVGVMMAHVMGVREPATLDRACDLGLAFQLTNIARDVLADAASDRVYLPLDWLAEAGVGQDEIAEPRHRGAVFAVVARLLEAAEPYYHSSRWGLPALRPRRAWAIATAHRVYREIGQQILARGEAGLDERSVVGRSRKVRHAVAGGVEAIVASTLGRWRRPPERTGLWTRPPLSA